jgi:hypothetical protein
MIHGEHTDLSESEARAIYREAWLFHRRLEDLTGIEAKILEWKMDWVQPYIASGPFDPKWMNFAASLPGYLEFWDNVPSAILAKLLGQTRLRVVEDSAPCSAEP